MYYLNLKLIIHYRKNVYFNRYYLHQENNLAANTVFMNVLRKSSNEISSQ